MNATREVFSIGAGPWRLAKEVSISRGCRIYDSWTYVVLHMCERRRLETLGNERTRLESALWCIGIAIVTALPGVVKRKLPGVRRRRANVLLIEGCDARGRSVSIPGLFALGLVRLRMRGLVVIGRGRGLVVIEQRPALVGWEDGFVVGVWVEDTPPKEGRRGNHTDGCGSTVRYNVCVVIGLDAHRIITARAIPSPLPSRVSPGRT